MWTTPTAAHEAAWREWLAARPDRVRAIAERFDPWTMYRLTTTGQRCQFLGCDVGAQNCGEIEADPERVTVRIYAENPILGAITGTEVFGISPDDLQPWTDDISIDAWWPMAPGATHETCSQCGAEVIGHHACEGVPGGFGNDGGVGS